MHTRVLIVCGALIVGSSCAEETAPVTFDAGYADRAISELGPREDRGIVADQGGPAVAPLVQMLCEVLGRCQEQLGVTFSDDAACERHFSRRYGCGGVPGAINVGAEALCLGWLQGVTCEDAMLTFGCVALARPLNCSDPLMQWGGRGAPGCAHVYEALVAGEGGSCEITPCDEDLYCKRGPTKAICPVCRPEAALGEACLYNPILPTHLPCAPGLYCSEAKQCASRLPPGQPCAVNRHCAGGFCRDEICADPLEAGEPIAFLALDQCRGFLVGREGTCAARRAAGEPCGFDVDCFLDGVCVLGKCQTRDVCAARSAGEPCVTEPLGCITGAFCNNTADPQLCEAVHGLGDPCEFTEDCGDDAYCSLNGQQCTAYAVSGGSCEGALLCAKNYYCDIDGGELCVHRLEDDSVCGYGFECLSEYCASGTSLCTPRPPCTMP